jgi:hypothetical protein
MDLPMTTAYPWSDLDLGHGFHPIPSEKRGTP